MHVYTITHEVSVRSHSIDLWDHLAFLRAFPADQRDKRYCPIARVSGNTSPLQAPVRLLLFPMLTTEKTSSVVPMSRANALQELIDQSMSKTTGSSQTQEELFFQLGTLVEQAPAYRVAIAHDATDGPQIIRALFGCGGRSR